MKKRDYLILGTALGAALGYLANSDRGRKFTAEVKEELAVKADSIKGKGSELVDVASEKVSHLQSKGSDLLNVANDKLAELHAKGNSYLRKMGQSPVKQQDIEQYIDNEVRDIKLKLLEKVEAKAEEIASNANSRKKTVKAS
ncbi:MAG: YtxH domain-containing protein [Saprospiraceae bacterium]|nr:YtxH domain-containing protein [Saprospiraceae bacterium]